MATSSIPRPVAVFILSKRSMILVLLDVMV
jgi:hypothetical protein